MPGQVPNFWWRPPAPPALRRLVPGCLILLLTAGVLQAAEPTSAGVARAPVPRLYVVLIGGMHSDPTAAQIAGTAARREGNSGLYQLLGDLQLNDQVVAEYFNWNGTRAGQLNAPHPPRTEGIVNCIREHMQQSPGDRLAIVGNSWGGHTAIEVTQALLASDAPLAFDLAVFLDASSTARGKRKPKRLPININHAVHYFTHNLFVWGKWPAGDRLENIDLGDKACGYRSDGGPAYQSAFDFRAHVAAEWDDRIHADIKRRLLEVLPEFQPAPRNPGP